MKNLKRLAVTALIAVSAAVGVAGPAEASHYVYRVGIGAWECVNFYHGTPVPNAYYPGMYGNNSQICKIKIQTPPRLV